MAGPDQRAKNREEIVRKINAGLNPREIDFSVEACGAIRVNRIFPGKVSELSKSIMAEIFYETGIPEDHDSECWNVMRLRIGMGRLLQITNLQRHVTWRHIMSKYVKMKHDRAVTGMPTCMPATDLAFIIAAVVFRGIRPEQTTPIEHKISFLEFFGHLNGMQWLPIAIQVYDQIKECPFAIELNQKTTVPMVRRERISIYVTIVTAKKPETNIYEAAMQEVTRRVIGIGDNIISDHSLNIKDQIRKSIENEECNQPWEAVKAVEFQSFSSDQPQELVGKVECHHVPLESVPPSIEKQSLDHKTQHEKDLESQPDIQLTSNTLRDHARQMKEFGKRLSSPDQKFVRRVRRDIRRFANLADEKENEMALEHASATSRPSSSSGFGPDADRSVDLFGRYKMLWKGSLRETGSIPESLRELVRYDCDPNQIFYLEETEADFLATNSMKNNENER
ncbi:hypothetical protein FPOAC1_008721 [Fusarium poae]|uniref:hypothetical protein n=1 Tax=Fusarium poae TaxID=36050 RepID=UPI001CE98962|nr:hypothetical protein FPOAC1_008721 [Fusarium poae]KAG8669329.1 hypothetical protein FPOAC1_008721 [Fusarium poae]